MRRCDATRDIHCFWSGSNSSLDAYARWEELLTSFTSSLLFTLCHFHQGQHWNCRQNVRFLVPSKHGKWDTVLRGRAFIASELFHILHLMYKKVGWDSDSMYMPYTVHTMSFLLRWTLKLYIKYRIWGTISQREIGYCAARKDIHCWWRGSTSSLDA